MATSTFSDPRRDVVFPIAGSVILFALLVAGGLVYQSFFGGAGERLVTRMLIDAIIVLGIQIYIGNTGVLSFGHIGFGAIAGYSFALLAIGSAQKLEQVPDAPFGLAEIELNPWLSIAAAVLVTLVVAFVVGIGLARSGAQSGAVSATVITLALLFVVHEIAVNYPDLTGGERAGLAFRVGTALKTRIPIYLALFGALVVARLYARSRSGRLAVAAREDNLAARAMGINPMIQQMTALLLSVAVVAVGASLRVYEDGSILPGNFFFNFTLVTLVMLIVGGRNSVTGAVVGVVVMTAGRELARRLGQDGFEIFGIGLDEAPLDWVFRENLQTVVPGLSMLAFMIWRPAGLLDDWELDHWLRTRFGGGATPVDRAVATSTAEPVAVGDPVEDTVADDDTGATATTLVVSGIDVRFGGFQALSEAGLEARTGEIVGIIGPNGAGKTTLVNVMTGLVPATAGSVHLGDHDLTTATSYERARRGLVRTFQNLRLFGALTVTENVEVSALVAERHRSERADVSVDRLVDAAGLADHRDRRARELDYGNSRRLELARAAAMAPEFLLLDEPTSGMSDSESLDMVEQVRAMAALVGAGVIVIDHDLAFITGICDRIYCLDRGRVIAEGSPTEIQADPAVQAAYLGITDTVEVSS
ncbi:MAG: branched-chain amino acid ABC transporter ATP-binding protein/permease [Actinomycetota bacterium]